MRNISAVINRYFVYWGEIDVELWSGLGALNIRLFTFCLAGLKRHN